MNDETTQTPGAPNQATPDSETAAPETAAAADQATTQSAATDDAAPSGVAAAEEFEEIVGEVTAPAETVGVAVAAPLGAELAALRAELAERTGDLQRVNAEYANYRRRVERDRAAVAEQATAQVVVALLPVLDDLDRAREHGDLVGPFATMAEQLGAGLAKFGLTGFGEVGDAFDPTRHEAVAHETSADVTAPTCVAVMRRGYQLGERLLRPALVAVADPASQ